MSNNLYFIPIIAHALEQKEPEKALKEAFEEIRAKGQRPEYSNGFKQFQQFMEIAKQHISDQKQDLITITHKIISELILEFVTGTFEGGEEERQAVEQLIMSRPEWQNEYRNLCAEIQETERYPSQINILVEKEGNLFGKMSFEEVQGFTSLQNIVPGHYIIKLETGRVLWEGELTEQDLIWTVAFHGLPLKVAADTKDLPKEPTREERLLNGELVLRVFPGLESGRIGIEIKK